MITDQRCQHNAKTVNTDNLDDFNMYCATPPTGIMMTNADVHFILYINRELVTVHHTPHCTLPSHTSSYTIPEIKFTHGVNFLYLML